METLEEVWSSGGRLPYALEDEAHALSPPLSGQVQPCDAQVRPVVPRFQTIAPAKRGRKRSARFWAGFVRGRDVYMSLANLTESFGACAVWVSLAARYGTVDLATRKKPGQERMLCGSSIVTHDPLVMWSLL